MSEYYQKSTGERYIVHCLQCHKPQESLSSHLARVCMKNSTPEERADEWQMAKISCREWVYKNRTWDYNQLRELLPDRRSLIGMVKEFLQRGFFIRNLPPEYDLDPEADPSNADVATTVTSSTDPAPSTYSSLKIKRKEAGLHGKFPAHAKLLVYFKKYLINSRKITGWQREVDNVSRFLRFLQPTASEPSLGFLSKSTETRDFLKALRCTGLCAATIFGYIKSILKFLECLEARLDLQKKDTQLRTKCKSYADMLKTVWKTESKTYDDKACDMRFGDLISGITDCQKILRVAKADFLRIHGDLLRGRETSNADKTMYRYYCEAILVFRHIQCPRVIKEFTDANWVERVAQGDRVVIHAVVRSKHERTASMQIALTQEEEACFQLYYEHIRPGNIGLDTFSQSFFVSTNGENLCSVSRDMHRLHDTYKLTPVKFQNVRKAVLAAAQQLPAHQREAVSQYLAPISGLAQPQDVVIAAMLLDSLSGNSSVSTEQLQLNTSMEQLASRKDFSAFVAKFPVSLEGQPPSKNECVESGFPKDRCFYDKWRVTQLTQRKQYLLSHFTHRKASAAKVAKLIAKKGWKSNCPKPEEIEKLWKPAPRVTIEMDQVIIKCVSEQTWTGLVIKDFGGEQGLGVVATRRFSKGDIVCDFHGRVIPAAEGRAMMQGVQDEARYLFFFKAGQRDLCIDAQASSCECHPHSNTIGRRIKRSSERPNLEPFHCVLRVNGEEKDVILFKALQDISVDTQLKFYSGVIVNSFLGLDLDWLDE